MFVYLRGTFHLHMSDRKSRENISKLQVASLKNQESMSLTLPACTCDLQSLDLQVTCFFLWSLFFFQLKSALNSKEKAA